MSISLRSPCLGPIVGNLFLKYIISVTYATPRGRHVVQWLELSPQAGFGSQLESGGRTVFASCLCVCVCSPLVSWTSSPQPCRYEFVRLWLSVSGSPILQDAPRFSLDDSWYPAPHQPACRIRSDKEWVFSKKKIKLCHGGFHKINGKIYIKGTIQKNKTVCSWVLALWISV